MSKKIVGMKQSIKAIKNGNAEIVYIAKDADDKIRNTIEELCKENEVKKIVYYDSMKQLGKEFGISVSASVACILK